MVTDLNFGEQQKQNTSYIRSAKKCIFLQAGPEIMRATAKMTVKFLNNQILSS